MSKFLFLGFEVFGIRFQIFKTVKYQSPISDFQKGLQSSIFVKIDSKMQKFCPKSLRIFFFKIGKICENRFYAAGDAHMHGREHLQGIPQLKNNNFFEY
jgi:hypothetical protein